MLAKHAGGDQRKLDAAFGDYELIINELGASNPGKIALVKSLVEQAGQNSPDALRMLRVVMQKNTFNPRAFNEALVRALADTVNEVSRKAGGKAPDALREMESIMEIDSHAGFSEAGPYGALEAIRTIAKRTGSRSLAGVLKLLGRVMAHDATMPESVGEKLAERLCDATEAVLRRAGGDGDKALNVLDEGFQYKTVGPLEQMDFAKIIASRVSDRKVFLDVLKTLVGRIGVFDHNPHMKGKAEAPTADSVRKLCDTANIIAGNAGASFRAKAMDSLDSFTWSVDSWSGMLTLAGMAAEDEHGAGVITRLDKLFGDAWLGETGEAAYIEGRELARSITHADKPGIRAVLNFSYAASLVGKQNALEMHKRFGITLFTRYEKEVLESMAENIVPGHASEKPLLLVACAKGDWNQALSYLNLEKLTRYYRLFSIEAKTKAEFFMRVRAVCNSYGEIDTMNMNAHGATDSMDLGRKEQKLDLSDKYAFRQLRGCFVPNPTVVLDSCSTGKDADSIGAMISSALDASVFAPVKPDSSMKFELNDEGKIVGMKPNEVPIRHYWNGRSQVIQPKPHPKHTHIAKK